MLHVLQFYFERIKKLGACYTKKIKKGIENIQKLQLRG